MWWILACASPPPETTVVSPDEAFVPLDAPRLLRRMSLDLRGILPSTEELDAAETADEAGLETVAERCRECCQQRPVFARDKLLDFKFAIAN